MNPMHLVVYVIALLTAWRLVSMYFGGAYVCPRCGARQADRHSDECPWQR